MKITKLWNTDKIHSMTDKVIRLKQLKKVRENLSTIYRYLTRVDVALDTLEGKKVIEAKKHVAKMFKLLNSAKNSESSMMIKVNMERFKDMI